MNRIAPVQESACGTQVATMLNSSKADRYIIFLISDVEMPDFFYDKWEIVK